MDFHLTLTDFHLTLADFRLSLTDFRLKLAKFAVKFVQENLLSQCIGAFSTVDYLILILLDAGSWVGQHADAAGGSDLPPGRRAGQTSRLDPRPYSGPHESRPGKGNHTTHPHVFF